MSFFFNGSTVGKLDDKNRFVIPQAMRYGLVEEGKLEFFIGIGLGGCLSIYKKEEIQKMVKAFKQKQHIGKFQKFFTLFFSTLTEATCDKIGRVNLPQLLKNAAKIKKEIVIAGVMDKIEIWPKEEYEKNLSEVFSSEESSLQDLTTEAFALLSEEDTSEKQADKTLLQSLLTPAAETK
jgi:MraZ protein